LTVAASSWREPPPPAPLKAYRCRYCRKVLFEADASGRLVLVCKRCKGSQEVRLTSAVKG
jgi:hypothetical protein